MSQQIDKKHEYFKVIGDYREIYNAPFSMLEQQVANSIADEIRSLNNNTLFTLAPYLNHYHIFHIKDQLKYTYEVIKILDDHVVLPRENFLTCIALPHNMPYLKVK